MIIVDACVMILVHAVTVIIAHTCTIIIVPLRTRIKEGTCSTITIHASSEIIIFAQQKGPCVRKRNSNQSEHIKRDESGGKLI